MLAFLTRTTSSSRHAPPVVIGAKKEKRSPARNQSGFMRTIVTGTIAVCIVLLIAETGGDVTERRDLRLGTPNQLTPVYKARRMNVRCQFCV